METTKKMKNYKVVRTLTETRKFKMTNEYVGENEEAITKKLADMAEKGKKFAKQGKGVLITTEEAVSIKEIK